MSDSLLDYRNASQSMVDGSFFSRNLFDVFDRKYVDHKNRMNGMLDNYPERNANKLLSSIFSANKHNYTRSVFELMLHEQLFRLGFVVVVKPDMQDQHAPDFLVTSPEGDSFYLEAATIENNSGAELLDQCKLKITEKRERYIGVIDKPLVIALNVIDGGLSQTEERDLFFGGDDPASSEDGIFTKDGRTGVRDDLAGVWYFDRLNMWRLPHARYCYIPNQFIRPQLLPAIFTSHNLLWMTDTGIEYFSGEPFLQVPANASAEIPTLSGEPAATSALEELLVCCACLTAFFLMLGYYLL